MNIEWTKKEQQAIDKLAIKQELSPQQILRQALRLYQSVCEGTNRVEPVEPPMGCYGFE